MKTRIGQRWQQIPPRTSRVGKAVQAQGQRPAARLQDTELQPIRRHSAGPQPAGHAKQYRRVPDRPAIASQNMIPVDGGAISSI